MKHHAMRMLGHMLGTLVLLLTTPFTSPTALSYATTAATAPIPQAMAASVPLATAPFSPYRSNALAPSDDTTPPSASWVSPLDSQTITTNTVRLEATASDDGGVDATGVNRVVFSARWSGVWHVITTIYTSPYQMDWNWCASGVPNGSVELALEAWDNAGNQFATTSGNGNITIIKDFNCNPPPTDAWRVEYFSDLTLTQSCYTHLDSSTYIFRKWDDAAPHVNCPADNFSARFSRMVNFQGGSYAFHIDHDAGVRLFIDGIPVTDAWANGLGSHDVTRTLTGWREVVLEYYDSTGFAALSAWWRGPGALPTPPASDPAQWLAQYYGNADLWGQPALVQNEGSGPLSHLWQEEGPGYGMPVDGFSARFTRQATFACGSYQFSVSADDGVRLRLTSADGGSQQVLDEWQTQTEDFFRDVDVAAGTYTVTVEYYDGGGNAALAVDWEQLAPCLQPPVAPALLSPSNNAFFDEYQNITLSWNPVTDAAEYRGHVWNGAGVDVTSVWMVSASWFIGPQPAGYQYQWQAQARNAAGTGNWSTTRTFTVRPAAPTGLTAQPASCTAVNLAWADNSAQEQGYRVYRDGVIVGSSGTNTSAHQDTGLSGSTTYTYQVRAFRNTVLSTFSNSVVVSTPPCVLPELRPHAPAGYVAPLVGSTVRGTHFTSTLYAGKPAYFDGYFINGGGETGPSPFNLELRVGARPPFSKTFAALPAGTGGGFDDVAQVVEQPGCYPVTLEVDPANTIAESNESNNVLSSTLCWLPVTGWWGEYFNNETLSGEPVLARNDDEINFDWSGASPMTNVVNAENFSVRWTRTVTFSAGTYRFHISRDDGARLYIDGIKVFDRWEYGRENHVVDIELTAGPHSLRFEMYDQVGWAQAILRWECITYLPLTFKLSS